MFGVETSSFFPKCQRDGRDLARQGEASHLRLHSLGQQSCVEVLQGACALTGTQGRTFEDAFHLVVVVLIQATDLLWFFGALQLSVHIAMLRAVVCYHCQTAVGLTAAAWCGTGRASASGPVTGQPAAGRSREFGAVFSRPRVSGSRLTVLLAPYAAPPTVHPSADRTALPGGAHQGAQSCSAIGRDGAGYR